jgi:hypothetical protein
MPVSLRVTLLAVLLGILLSAVRSGISITMKWDYAARHPAQDWRNDLSPDALILTVVLAAAWLVGAAAVVGSAVLAAKRIRAGQIALTIVLALFVAYTCGGPMPARTSGTGSAPVPPTRTSSTATVCCPTWAVSGSGST